MIELNNVQIRFGDFVAIENLSLEIQKGEFFTFLGPSGCGKTTTLRAIAGFIIPTHGSVKVKNEDITYKPIEKRGIGMVFQSYALFPTMSVEENIIFGLKENKWSKENIRLRLKEVADMVNLTSEQLKKNVSQLSGGQQQRVAIARTLALRPEIIVLDEPLSNLDARLRVQLRMELKKIQLAAGVTMIYVTHDQEEALTLSDRIAVFNNGCIEQIGTPREVYYHPKTEFVSQFIGDSNRLTPGIVQRLVELNPDFTAERDKHVYVRGEHVKEEISPEESAEYLVLDAEFELEEFYGLTTRKTFKVGNDSLKSISTNINGIMNRGERKRLYISKNDLMTFRGE
ncbi:ABC transporter ATP-binding protein [Paenibacillus sanguinis]|uniref:ABC transporter ATP-binding protein n=1 Tax=Paenibacillus sanguinis TaxID=225906 RepID=UPI000381FDA6|nr:ABC transporter ATP-binding protein [Paenibacillus sanguinis]